MGGQVMYLSQTKQNEAFHQQPTNFHLQQFGYANKKISSYMYLDGS